MRKPRPRTGILVWAALAAGASWTALAQSSTPSAFSGDAPQTQVVFRPGPETYGTSSLTVAEIGAPDFTPRAGATIQSGAGMSRFANGPIEASPTDLPNGASIEQIEIRACDTSATEQVQLNFGPCNTGGGSCSLAGSVSTGVAATPGCGAFSVAILPPVVVNNLNPILVQVNTASIATTFDSVRIYYRLQVSPPPGVATFGDVPTTSPQFKFVEALVAAGITAGCGGGNYCPDQPVTRGQMAVFLAVSLGLHWPN